jgi:hypothetical protein
VAELPRSKMVTFAQVVEESHRGRPNPFLVQLQTKRHRLVMTGSQSKTGLDVNRSVMIRK